MRAVHSGLRKVTLSARPEVHRSLAPPHLLHTTFPPLIPVSHQASSSLRPSLANLHFPFSPLSARYLSDSINVTGGTRIATHSGVCFRTPAVNPTTQLTLTSSGTTEQKICSTSYVSRKFFVTHAVSHPAFSLSRTLFFREKAASLGYRTFTVITTVNTGAPEIKVKYEEKLPLPNQSGFLFKFKHDKDMLIKLIESDLEKYQEDYINFIKGKISGNKDSYVFSIIPTTINYNETDRFFEVGKMLVSDYQYHFTSKPLSEKIKKKISSGRCIVFEKVNIDEFTLHFNPSLFSDENRKLVCHVELNEIYEKAKKELVETNDLITIKDNKTLERLTQIALSFGVTTHYYPLKQDDKIKPGHLSCYTNDDFISHMFTKLENRDESIKKDVKTVIDITKNNKDYKIFYSFVLVIKKNLFPTVSMKQIKERALPYDILARANTDNCCTVFWPWIWKQYFHFKLMEYCHGNQDNMKKNIRRVMNPVDFIAHMLNGIFVERFEEHNVRSLLRWRLKDKNLEAIDSNEIFVKMLRDFAIRSGSRGIRLSFGGVVKTPTFYPQSFRLSLEEKLKGLIDEDAYLIQYSIYQNNPEKYKREFYGFLENAGMRKSLFSINHGVDNSQTKAAIKALHAGVPVKVAASGGSPIHSDAASSSSSSSSGSSSQHSPAPAKTTPR